MDHHKEQIYKLIESYCKIESGLIDEKTIKLAYPDIDFESIKSVMECLFQKNLTMGKNVAAFEKQFKEFHGMKHGIMVNSGSSANLLAISVLTNPLYKEKLRLGDEVIVPALCWPTTLWPIIQCGLKVVLVDCHPTKLTICPDSIKKAISEKTKAIFLIHTYGNPCEMDEICDIADRKNILILEDSCEATGSKYKDKYVGQFGLISSYSFYLSHQLSTIEGGMCLTNDPSIAQIMQSMRAHGWSRNIPEGMIYKRENNQEEENFFFITSGFNFKPTEIQGALGNREMKRLTRNLDKRRENACLLRSYISDISDTIILQEEQKEGIHTWFGFPLLMKGIKSLKSVSIMRKYLEEEGIETRPVIAGNITNHPCFKLYKDQIKVPYELSNTQETSAKGFVVGNSPSFSLVHLQKIANTLKKGLSII